MAHTQHIDNEFSARFFSDIFQLYPQSSRQYRCTDISDIHYCQLGVLRCLSSSTTGQEFLQFHADQGIANIEVSHFFKALKSARRLANITSLNDLLAGPMKSQIPDPYAQCAELDDCLLIKSSCSTNTAGILRRFSTSSKARWASANPGPVRLRPNRVTRSSSVSPTIYCCSLSNTLGKAKGCATCWRRKRNKAGPNRQS